MIEVGRLWRSIWKNTERNVEISITDSRDALLGSHLLEGQKLTVDYDKRVVLIEP
jgi:hypothetical protein